MQEWIDRLAQALGEEALTGTERGRLLNVSRDVAHRVERKTTPLAAFLLGLSVGRRAAGGSTRSDAIALAVGELTSILPEEPPEG